MAGEGDVQLAFLSGPAPTAVTLGARETIVPKTVNAVFDGSGAAAFRPCLIITSKAGNEVARIPADEVAAGASAEVSWFPRVAAAAAKATGSGFSWCAASGTGNNIAPGASGDGLFLAATNDPAAFADSSPVPGKLVFNKTGTYLLLFSFDAHKAGAPVANPWTTVLQGGPGNWPGSILFGPQSFSDAIGSISQHWDKTWSFCVTVNPLQVGGHLDWNWNNLSGATLSSVESGVVVIRLAD